jgi:DNA-binding CsgD family transcriptional regulator
LRDRDSPASEDAAAAERRPLLERRAEFRSIEDAIRAVTSSRRGGVVVVQGPAGIGKTRLLQAAAELAANRGWDVLRGTGSELERALPFGVVLQLFEARLTRLSGAERDELLSGAAAVAQRLFAGAGAAAGPPRSRALSVVHGLYWLTSNLSESAPLLIVVDDAQWADREALEFLLYLARRVDDLPALMAVSWRVGEPDSPEEFLAQLCAHPGGRVLRPAPLSAAGVAELVRLRFPGAREELCRACAQASDGNPFLINELLTALETDHIDPDTLSPELVGRLPPPTIRRSVMLRLARLPRGCLQLARAIAVLGPDATLRRAARLAELEPGSVAFAADALAAAEIIDLSERSSFVHPLLASAVYADIPVAARADAHLRAARGLGDEGLAPERLAAHLLMARESCDSWVVDNLLAAARHALGEGAPTSAVQYLRRALSEPPTAALRRELLVELARAEAVSGDPASASQHLGEALALTDEPRDRARLLLDLGHAFYLHGELRRAVAAFDHGLVELASKDPELDAELQAGWVTIARLDPSMRAEAVRRLDEILERPGVGSTHGERVLLAQAAGQLVFAGEQRQRAVTLAARALAGGRLIEEEAADGMNWLVASGALAWSDEFAASAEPIAAALADARTRGSITGFAQASYARSFLLHHQGDLAGAVVDLEAAVDGIGCGWRQFLPAVYAQLAWARIERGELAAAAAALAEVDECEWGQTSMQALVLEARAHLHLVEGRPADALGDALAAGRVIVAALVPNPSLVPWRSRAALAAARLGDLDHARTLVGEELELARRFGAPRPIGVALRAAGLIEPGDAGIDLLKEAVEALEQSPARLEHARALVDLGSALRRRRHRADAREPLRSGLDMAHRFGARLIAEQARTELLATGARPRRLVLTGVDSLTPSERRVAEFAAEGLSNRQIAQALFVSLRTVEAHLRHIYRKLDVSSRRDLDNALAGRIPTAS